MNVKKINNPVISVLMSCYNAEKWLHSSIPSVLNQTFFDFEFIIVNDGSTDSTINIIKNYIDIDSRIILLNKINTGLADSLNAGIQASRGEWIARIDADDLCEPNRLKSQLIASIKNDKVIFVGSNLLKIDLDGIAIKSVNFPTSHSHLVRNLTTIRKFPAHSSAFYRTTAVRSVGGYRKRINRAEDRDLWLRLSEIGELASVPELLVQLREHPEQISGDGGGRVQTLDSTIAVVSYYLRRSGCKDPLNDSDELFNEFKAWLGKEVDRLDANGLKSFRRNLRHAFYSNKSLHQRFFSLMILIFGNPILSIRMIHQNIFGFNYPKTLALKWQRRVITK
ncbi:MAG: hypothetical protein ACD_46C00193G0002 [uncultured bacterium]|nr:MAG: hypothetical protein ACD_46C00193G0002 [uncultured bacterium]